MFKALSYRLTIFYVLYFFFQVESKIGSYITYYFQHNALSRDLTSTVGKANDVKR